MQSSTGWLYRLSTIYSLAFYLSHIGLWLWCLMSLLPIYQLYCGSQFYCWRKREYLENTTDFMQITDKLYHIMLIRVHFAISGIQALMAQIAQVFVYSTTIWSWPRHPSHIAVFISICNLNVAIFNYLIVDHSWQYVCRVLCSLHIKDIYCRFHRVDTLQLLQKAKCFVPIQLSILSSAFHKSFTCLSHHSYFYKLLSSSEPEAVRLNVINFSHF